MGTFTLFVRNSFLQISSFQYYVLRGITLYGHFCKELNLMQCCLFF